jgi:putative tricarboxylic transport membrane protein
MNDRRGAFLNRYGRACWSLVLFVGGIILLANLQLTITYKADPGELGPAFWPRLWVLILLVLSAVDGLLAVRRASMGSAAAQDPSVPAECVDPPDERAVQRLLMVAAGAALVALYVLATITTGFAIATPVFVMCFAYLGGFKRWVTLMLVALIGTVVLLYLFVAVVYIALPLGQGPFIEINSQIYKILGIF